MKLTNKRRAEILRAARIFNTWELCKGSAFVHTSSERYHSGTFVTSPGRAIYARKNGPLAWYEKADRHPFYDDRAVDPPNALEQAFAFAVKLTGVPRDQWVLAPFGGRSEWVPKPVLDAAVEKALAQAAQ